MKNLKYFCSFTIALFLCMRVSWADQSGMVTIKLPKYMADFFAPVPSARIAEEHKMIFIAHYNGLDERYLAVNTPAHRKCVKESLFDPLFNVAFSWNLAGNNFSTNLIPNNISGINLTYTAHEYNGSELTFRGTLEGPEFETNMDKNEHARLSYTITTDNASYVRYEFLYRIGVVAYRSGNNFLAVRGTVQETIQHIRADAIAPQAQVLPPQATPNQLEHEQATAGKDNDPGKCSLM